MSDNGKRPFVLEGHRSASQRRESALHAEIMRMKILADHLRAVIILMLRQFPENTFTVEKKKIEETLGHPLDSVDSEDKLSVVFSCDDDFVSCLSIDCARKADPHAVGDFGCTAVTEP